MTTRLIFEPHNGFGGMDLDEQPYPFGYISEGVGRPIFELGVPLLKPNDPTLLPLALKMTAAEAMFAALERCEQMVSTDAGPPDWDWLRTVLAQARGA